MSYHHNYIQGSRQFDKQKYRNKSQDKQKHRENSYERSRNKYSHQYKQRQPQTKMSKNNYDQSYHQSYRKGEKIVQNKYRYNNKHQDSKYEYENADRRIKQKNENYTQMKVKKQNQFDNKQNKRFRKKNSSSSYSSSSKSNSSSSNSSSSSSSSSSSKSSNESRSKQKVYIKKQKKVYSNNNSHFQSKNNNHPYPYGLQKNKSQGNIQVILQVAPSIKAKISNKSDHISEKFEKNHDMNRKQSKYNELNFQSKNVFLPPPPSYNRQKSYSNYKQLKQIPQEFKTSQNQNYRASWTNNKNNNQKSTEVHNLNKMEIIYPNQIEVHYPKINQIEYKKGLYFSSNNRIEQAKQQRTEFNSNNQPEHRIINPSPYYNANYQSYNYSNRNVFKYNKDTKDYKDNKDTKDYKDYKDQSISYQFKPFQNSYVNYNTNQKPFFNQKIQQQVKPVQNKRNHQQLSENAQPKNIAIQRSEPMQIEPLQNQIKSQQLANIEQNNIKLICKSPQKIIISETQQLIQKAKANLTICAPQTTYLILDSFKNMNSYKAQTMNASWRNKLYQQLQQIQTYKVKIFPKIQSIHQAQIKSKMLIEENDNQQIVQGRRNSQQAKQIDIKDIQIEQPSQKKQVKIWMWSKGQVSQSQRNFKASLQSLRKCTQTMGDMLRRIKIYN